MINCLTHLPALRFTVDLISHVSISLLDAHLRSITLENDEWKTKVQTLIPQFAQTGYTYLFWVLDDSKKCWFAKWGMETVMSQTLNDFITFRWKHSYSHGLRVITLKTKVFHQLFQIGWNDLCLGSRRNIMNNWWVGKLNFSTINQTTEICDISFAWIIVNSHDLHMFLVQLKIESW